MRRTRIRPVSRKRARRDRDYPKQRERVYERSGGFCEAPMHDVSCTGRCEQVHHLAGRQGPDPHRLDNLIGLSAACHRLAHARPQLAREWGLSVSRLGGDA